MRDWRRIRVRVVWGLYAFVLLTTAVAADALCHSLPSLFDDSSIDAGSRWERLLFAAGAFGLGFGFLAHDALSLLFVRLGLEPKFRPVTFYYPDSDKEFSRRERMLIAYPVDALFAVAGLQVWVSTLG